MATTPARKTRPPKLGRTSNGMLMTPEEFDAVTRYDDRYTYELVHGVLIVSPFASIGERDLNEELGHLLRTYKTTHPQGAVLDKTVFEQYVYLPASRRRADRLVWAGLGRVPDPRKDVPTIAVEFVSKSTRDRVRDYEEKRREYLELGVREYWIIDRFECGKLDGLPPHARQAGRAGLPRQGRVHDPAAPRLRASPGPAVRPGRRLGSVEKRAEEQAANHEPPRRSPPGVTATTRHGRAGFPGHRRPPR